MGRLKKYILNPLALPLLGTFTLSGQGPLYRDTIVVKENGVTLMNPWAGGLNFCELSQVDLNMDGKADIVVYDKVCSSGGKLRAFLNEGGVGQTIYRHSPALQAQLPAVTDWAMFYDYDGDGRQDLFTYITGGIRVFKNTSSLGNCSFTLAKPLLYTDYNPGGAPNISNLYCNPVALPGIGDVDGDGDLDVLTFSVFGIQIEYHKNMSMEKYGHADSLVFAMVDNCWGDIYENNCQVYLSQCPYQKLYKDYTSGGVSKPLHAGSCIMCYDRDGDNDQDLILGDISCNIVHYVNNIGSNTNAHIGDTTQLYPNYPAKGNTTVVRMNAFPCTYYFDADNDGKKDLLASPNSIAGAENYNSVWFYKNMSSNNVVDFQIQKKDFLQDQMIEVGEGASPLLFDADADGKKDLLIGNAGYYSNGVTTSKIAFYKNTGMPSTPSFSLITRDYQGLSQYSITAMFPAFGDLDNDGDQDLVVGDYNGTLTYFENVASSGAAANFGPPQASYFSIDVGQNAAPQLVDADKNGTLDLLIGNQTGKLTYYKNTGTNTTPNFVLQTASFGGVDVRSPNFLTGYSTPFLYDDAGVSRLLVGSESGNIFLYNNIDGNLTGTFTKTDTNLYHLNEGTRSALFFEDVNSDTKRDLFLGNYAGGLGFFSSVANSIGIEELTNDPGRHVSLFPNPANGHFTVSVNTDASLKAGYTLFDALGHVVMQRENNEKVNEFNTQGLTPGFYFMQVEFISENNRSLARATKKIIIR